MVWENTDDAFQKQHVWELNYSLEITVVIVILTREENKYLPVLNFSMNHFLKIILSAAAASSLYQIPSTSAGLAGIIIIFQKYYRVRVCNSAVSGTGSVVWFSGEIFSLHRKCLQLELARNVFWLLLYFSVLEAHHHRRRGRRVRRCAY